MKIARHTITALVLLLTPAAVASALQDPPEGGDGGSSPVRPSKKSAPAPVSFTVHLAGLEAAAGTKLLADVRALQHPVFGCPDCTFTGRHEGACPVCSATLTERGKTDVFQLVKLSIDRRYLDVKLHPGRWGSMAELEAHITEAGARIKPADMRVPTFARIAVKGLAAEDAEKARAVLRDDKIFRDVTTIAGEKAEHTWIVPKLEPDGSVPKPIKLGQVAESIAKVVEGVTVVDVQWTTPCVACAKNGAIRTGCRTCWRH